LGFWVTISEEIYLVRLKETGNLKLDNNLV